MLRSGINRRISWTELVAFFRDLWRRKSRPTGNYCGSYLDLLWPRMNLIFFNALDGRAPFAWDVYFSQMDSGFSAVVGSTEVYLIPKLRARRFFDDDDYESLDKEAVTAAQKVIEFRASGLGTTVAVTVGK